MPPTHTRQEEVWKCLIAYREAERSFRASMYFLERSLDAMLELSQDKPSFLRWLQSDPFVRLGVELPPYIIEELTRKHA